ncbi:MAG: DUF2796 domain-containing protein [Deltaproteobacteria bacterium]|jgi:hypothetical protein|nr:DUF2796 domain-containing protein [Deltaproteobacteria bacterium]
MKKFLFSAPIFLLIIGLGSYLYAQGDTHPAHVHGVGNVNISIDDKTVDIDLSGPLANYISFEHVPSTDAEKAEMKSMVDKLSNPTALFTLPADWGCTPEAPVIEGENIPEDILGHAHSVGDHGHDHGHDDGHDHGHDDGHDHGHDDGHDHGEGGEHSDVDVEISYNCTSIKADTGEIDAKGLFTSFSNLHELNVQLIRPGGQTGVQLEPDKSVIKW